MQAGQRKPPLCTTHPEGRRLQGPPGSGWRTPGYTHTHAPHGHYTHPPRPAPTPHTSYAHTRALRTRVFTLYPTLHPGARCCARYALPHTTHTPYTHTLHRCTAHTPMGFRLPFLGTVWTLTRRTAPATLPARAPSRLNLKYHLQLRCYQDPFWCGRCAVDRGTCRIPVLFFTSRASFYRALTPFTARGTLTAFCLYSRRSPLRSTSGTGHTRSLVLTARTHRCAAALHRALYASVIASAAHRLPDIHYACHRVVSLRMLCFATAPRATRVVARLPAQPFLQVETDDRTLRKGCRIFALLTLYTIITRPPPHHTTRPHLYALRRAHTPHALAGHSDRHRLARNKRRRATTTPHRTTLLPLPLHCRSAFAAFLRTVLCRRYANSRRCTAAAPCGTPRINRAIFQPAAFEHRGRTGGRTCRPGLCATAVRRLTAYLRRDGQTCF